MVYADRTMQIPRTICLKCVCHFFFRFSFSCRRRKSLPYNSASDDSQRPAPICAPFPIIPPAPSPTVHSTTTLHQRVTHSHLSTSRMHLTATASSCPQLGVRHRSDAKVGARDGRTIFCLTSELTRTSPMAREKCLRPSGQDQRREVHYKPILQSFLLTPHSRPRSRPSTSRRPKQAFLAKTYDENARRTERDTRGVFRTPADASAVTAAGIEPFGSSFLSLPTVKRAYRKWTVSASASRRPPSREKCKCTDVVHPRDQPSAGSQNFFKSVGYNHSCAELRSDGW